LLAARREPEIIAHIQRLVPEYNPAAKLARDQSEETAPADEAKPPRSPLWSCVEDRVWMP